MFWGNLHLTFDYSTYSQKYGEDFAKFCGLLRTLPKLVNHTAYSAYGPSLLEPK